MVARTNVGDSVRLRSSALPSVLPSTFKSGLWPRGQMIIPYILHGAVHGADDPSIHLVVGTRHLIQLIIWCEQDIKLFGRDIKLSGQDN